MSMLTRAIDDLKRETRQVKDGREFVDDLATAGETATVTNPNNNVTVDSFSKQIKNKVDESIGEIVSAEVADTLSTYVTAASEHADSAEESAAAAITAASESESSKDAAAVSATESESYSNEALTYANSAATSSATANAAADRAEAIAGFDSDSLLTTGDVDAAVVSYLDTEAGENAVISAINSGLDQSDWQSGNSYYDIRFGFTDAPAANEIIDTFPMPRKVTFKAGLVGCAGSVSSAPDENFIMTVKSNGVAIAQITATPTSVITYSTFGSGDVVVSSGSILTIVAPSTYIGSIANVVVVLAGEA